MFEYCAQPETLEGVVWLSCYMTTPKHINLYYSLVTVLALLLAAAPAALFFGFLGAFAKRSSVVPLKILGQIYTGMVRGIPDIVFFLFVPIALDQLFEIIRHKLFCPEVTEAIYQGNDFVVCQAAKLPLGGAPEWVHDSYGFILAVIAFALVFGAFAANVLSGALDSVPKGQLEAARAYGMSSGQAMLRIHLPQMWRYALPGLSNLWQLLIKATPLLFLIGVEDIVYWANTLGASKPPSPSTSYPHPDWRFYYFLALMVFYLVLSYASNRFFEWIRRRVSKGVSVITAGQGV